MKIYATLVIILFPFLSLAQAGQFIHIDQFGYQVNAEKVAVISDPQIGYNSTTSFTPTTTLLVRDATTNQTVFSGNIFMWNNGNTHNNSGDQGWWFDFSSVITPGTYYIFDSVNNERSFDFEINDNPYYQVLKDAGRMFYYNRCNAEKNVTHAGIKWADGNNFSNAQQDAQCSPIYDSNNTALVRDLSGGWFDAGDYNKYVSFTYSTLHNLLNAYEENPTAFGDDWNIPESGNGIPDIIDEIKWETDWLLKMVDSSGLTPIKVGSKNYSDNTSNPPSANTDRRFYGPNCTSASVSAASVLAHAGVVMKDFPALINYVDSLAFKAKVALDYVRPLFFSNGFELNCDDGSIISGDADVDSAQQANRLMTASIYLWELNGDMDSKNFVDFNYFIYENYVNYSWNAYENANVSAFVRYANHANANPNVANNIATNIDLTATYNWSGYFGWDSSDLYRAPVPDWTYHWGSNQFVAEYGNINHSLADYRYGQDSINQRKRANEILHYFHGVNPNGLCYLSNMYDAGSENCINEIYHTWFADMSDYDHALNSPSGPPPGYLVGGPNEYFSVSTLTPPYGQPRQKAYLDFNINWPQNSWEVSEPAIYYQAAYIRLLSKYVQPYSAPTSLNETNKLNKIEIYPNPTNDVINLKGINNKMSISIFNLSGQQVIKFPEGKQTNSIDISMLQTGVYLLQIQNENSTQQFKIIKR